MSTPLLWLLMIGLVCSGCASLSGGSGRMQVAPLQVQTGGPGSEAFVLVDAEEITMTPLSPVVVPEPPPMATMGVGERSRPDGRYLPLVLFPLDSWDLTPEAETILQQAGDWLRTYLHGELAIEGHTDSQGTEAYNQALGYKRALAVIQYLEDLGLKAGTMKPISYGELDPICQKANAFCDDMNRRAFVFVSDQALAPLLAAFELPSPEAVLPMQENHHD